MNNPMLGIIKLRQEGYIHIGKELEEQVREELTKVIRLQSDKEIVMDDIEELKTGPMDDADEETLDALQDELFELDRDLYFHGNSLDDLRRESHRISILVDEYNALVELFEGPGDQEVPL